MSSDVEKGAGPLFLRSLLCAIAVLFIAAGSEGRGQPTTGLAWREIVPGVEHATLQRTLDAKGQPVGPFAINALRLELSKVRLDVVHALDEAVGLETTSSIADRLGAI